MTEYAREWICMYDLILNMIGRWRTSTRPPLRYPVLPASLPIHDHVNVHTVLFMSKAHIMSMHNDPHALRIGPEARIEEIVRNLDVRDVRLVQLESEPTGGENGGQGEVKFAVCETVGFTRYFG